MVSKEHHPQMAARFRLVKYYFIYPDEFVLLCRIKTSQNHLWEDPKRSKKAENSRRKAWKSTSTSVTGLLLGDVHQSQACVPGARVDAINRGFRSHGATPKSCGFSPNKNHPAIGKPHFQETSMAKPFQPPSIVSLSDGTLGVALCSGLDGLWKYSLPLDDFPFWYFWCSILMLKLPESN